MPSRLGQVLLLWLVLLVGGAPRLAADFAADLARFGVESAGGVAAHEALRGLRAMGVISAGGREASFILHAERPARLRIETVGERGSLVRASDGVHAPWKLEDPLQGPRRLGRGEERDFLLDAEFDSPLFEHARRGISLDYAGRVVLEGRAYQRLLAVLRHTELVTLFIDEESGLLTRREQRKRVGGREVLLVTLFEDFRPVAGVLLPHRIRTLAGEQVLTDARIETLDPNPPLPENFFAPPVPAWPRL